MAGDLCCRQVTVFRKNASGAEHPVLQKVDAVFPSGAVCRISGPNGAGKSTLLHVMAGLLRPAAGEVLWDGRPVSRWSAHHRDRWRRTVGISFQSALLLEDITAMENVMAPLIPLGLSVSELRKRAAEALERLGLGETASDPVRELSGGQRQRIGIARAAVVEPALLLADEPAAHQDADGIRRIQALLSDIADRGGTVVLAGHGDDGLFTDSLSVFRFQLARGRLKAAT